VGGQRHRLGRSTSVNDPVPIVKEAGCASGPVWTDAKHLDPTGIRSSDLEVRSQSLVIETYGYLTGETEQN